MGWRVYKRRQKISNLSCVSLKNVDFKKSYRLLTLPERVEGNTFHQLARLTQWMLGNRLREFQRTSRGGSQEEETQRGAYPSTPDLRHK